MLQNTNFGLLILVIGQYIFIKSKQICTYKREDKVDHNIKYMKAVFK